MEPPSADMGATWKNGVWEDTREITGEPWKYPEVEKKLGPKIDYTHTSKKQYWRKSDYDSIHNWG